MRFRLLVALMALIGLTAFAPAPFFKARQRNLRGGDLLPGLQGVWSIVEKHRMGPNGQVARYTTTQKIQIEKNRWQFFSPAVRGRVRPVEYLIELLGDDHPRRFRIKRAGTETDYMVGILAIQGGTVKMLYHLGSRPATTTFEPAGFDVIPEGWYLMTLKRDP